MAVDSEGTRTDPLPNNTNRTEPKVKWGAIAAYVLGAVGLFLVDMLTADENALLLDVLPDPVEWFVLPIVPAAASLVAGYRARHQYRVAETSGTKAPGTYLD